MPTASRAAGSSPSSRWSTASRPASCPYVEVSEDAVVTSGNGFFGQPEALGEYPLLDTRAVIDRANAQSGSGIEPALGDRRGEVERHRCRRRR